MHRKNDLSRAFQLTANRAAIYVVRCEQTSEERRARFCHAKPPGQRIHKFIQFPRFTAKDIETCLVAGLRAFYYGRRNRCNVCFVSLTVYVFYKLTDSMGKARQYGSAQRARLAPPVSTAHSFPQSSTPDGVAAAGIVKDMPVTAAARRYTVVVDTKAY